MAEAEPNVPNVIVKPSLMTKQQVAVGIDGELVTFTVGNSTLKMHYEEALKISQWLRVRAKQAKRLAGDVSRHWSAIAVLDGIKG